MEARVEAALRPQEKINETPLADTQGPKSRLQAARQGQIQQQPDQHLPHGVEPRPRRRRQTAQQRERLPGEPVEVRHDGHEPGRRPRQERVQGPEAHRQEGGQAEEVRQDVPALLRRQQRRADHPAGVGRVSYQGRHGR